MADMPFEQLVLEKLGLLDVLVKKFDTMETRMDGFESTQNRMIQKMVEMDEYMHTELATKSELSQVKEDLTQQLDLIAMQTSP